MLVKGAIGVPELGQTEPEFIMRWHVCGCFNDPYHSRGRKGRPLPSSKTENSRPFLGRLLTRCRWALRLITMGHGNTVLSATRLPTLTLDVLTNPVITTDRMNSHLLKPKCYQGSNRQPNSMASHKTEVSPMQITQSCNKPLKLPCS